MNVNPTTGFLLLSLLEKQNKQRRSNLFRQGRFIISYRAKVSSHLHPNLETIVSAGEPCGYWHTDYSKDFGNLQQRREELPLIGYIPASSIRGVVRAWVKEYEKESIQRMEELLGKQDKEGNITPGKINFLDGWSENPYPIELDMVNPQQEFQVYHDSKKQSNPQPLYCFGKPTNPIAVTIAIQGTIEAEEKDVDQVWQWLTKALANHGLGSRTSTGYGRLVSDEVAQKAISHECTRVYDFTLLTQGCYGVCPPTKENSWKGKPELRPTHWRGWLRSWLLRFLLGVMNKQNAEKTLAELMGTIEPSAVKGWVRIEVTGLADHKESKDRATFHRWQGQLVISAPEEILKPIVLPVVKFAVSVGGLGRGWRRPLHIFHRNGKDFARGCILRLSQKDTNGKPTSVAMSLNPEQWQKNYNDWKNEVTKRWHDRVVNQPTHSAEVFAPHACTVYLVPGPASDPIRDLHWSDKTGTKGAGMNLIYQPNYKHKTHVGGDAGSGKAACSWVSITRVNCGNGGCKEIVCLFLGGINPNQDRNHLRSRFLQELKGIKGAIKLFGSF